MSRSVVTIPGDKLCMPMLVMPHIFSSAYSKAYYMVQGTLLALLHKQGWQTWVHTRHWSLHASVQRKLSAMSGRPGLFQACVTRFDKACVMYKLRTCPVVNVEERITHGKMT